MALLELKNITRRFGELEAVKDVTLAIKAGEFFTLLGPSGCGKTTILRMIAGFDAPDEGDILLDGKSLAGVQPEQRPVHTVFQSYALFPHMSVAGNVAFPLEMAGVSRTECRRRVTEALARGLINRPRLLLLDESLSALDAKLREEMQIDLIALRPELIRVYDHKESADLKNRFEGRVKELLYLGDVTLYKVELANGFVVETLMTNAAPGRAKFHEVGDAVAVCWRHDAGIFLRD